MTKFMMQFIAARNVSTPIIAARTVDPAATMGGIAKNQPTSPMFVWDIVNGLFGYDKASSDLLREITDEPCIDPVDALRAASKFPEESILFLCNFHRFITDVQPMQALWNIRDVFKQNHRTAVLLVPDITLPIELAQDILLLDEPLPTNEELAEIVKQLYNDTRESSLADHPNMPELTQEMITRAVDATCGLAAFTAETCIAMSITPEGIDYDALWERKRKMIENVKGLSVHRGKETLDDVVGLPNLVKFMRHIKNGRRKYRGIVFLDEADKHVANFGAVGTGDTTQEMMGPVLSFMEDNEIEGLLFTGIPGCGKSLTAKALGNEMGCPTMIFDFSGMKASHVGESGANIRAALKIAYAMSQGELLFCATANEVSNLPAEFRSRFALGTFFFDNPTPDGRDAAWTMYEKKHEIKKQERPRSEGWTPREIRNCCRTASNLDIPLKEAAKYIVPVSKSNAQRIEKLRREADGAYLDTVNEGFYQFVDATRDGSTKGRAIKMER